MKRKVEVTKPNKEALIDILNDAEYFTNGGNPIEFNRSDFSFRKNDNGVKYRLDTPDFPLHQLIEHDFRDDMADGELTLCAVSDDNPKPETEDTPVLRQVTNREKSEDGFIAVDNGTWWKYATPVTIAVKEFE